MKKIIPLAFFICTVSLIHAQNSPGVGIGFQYGTARVFDNGETLRKITEPGIRLSIRSVPAVVGIFGHIGLLFPFKVTEGDVTLSYGDYKYIFFLNSAMGASFKIPINDRFSFFIDAGISINDLLYGGSFKDTIDASWTIKLENLGTTYKGGYKFENIKMKERYNDVSFGIAGNAAMRINFSTKVFFEIVSTVSLDFLRLRKYKFSADFTSGPYGSNWEKEALNVFPRDKLKIVDENTVNERATELILESDCRLTVFKQFTFIPGVCVGFSF